MGISTKPHCQNMSTAVTDGQSPLLRVGGIAFGSTLSRESMRMTICFTCKTLLSASHLGKKLICCANLFSWNFNHGVKTIMF